MSVSLGGFSLLMSCCCAFISIPLAIGALITGYLGKKQIDESGGRQKGSQMAVIGMVLGGIAILLSVIFMIFGAVVNLAQLGAAGGGTGY